MAQQRGLESELIAQSDASRLLETVATSEGELTIWRRLGQVAEFRLQGVAQGQVSARTDVTPQPAEDILPAILGLANHPQPGRVLVLGDETGAMLRTVPHFPVQEIVGLRTSTACTARAVFYNCQHYCLLYPSDIAAEYSGFVFGGWQHSITIKSQSDVVGFHLHYLL